MILDLNWTWGAYTNGPDWHCKDETDMQDLVDAVRATGAANIRMLGGLEWANDMREWLAYTPTDPQDTLAASEANRC